MRFGAGFAIPELTSTRRQAPMKDCAVEEVRPAVVILDVHLPDGSGLETFERIRASMREFP